MAFKHSTGAAALVFSVGMAMSAPALAAASAAHQDEAIVAHTAAGVTCTTKTYNQPAPHASNPKDVFRHSSPVREKACRKG